MGKTTGGHAAAPFRGRESLAPTRAFGEVLDALAEAIREGQQTRRATREEVFRILRGKT